MSDPHKPNRPDEAERIKLARGWITEERELYMARLHRMDLSDPVVRDKAQQVVPFIFFSKFTVGSYFILASCIQPKQQFRTVSHVCRVIQLHYILTYIISFIYILERAGELGDDT